MAKGLTYSQQRAAKLALQKEALLNKRALINIDGKSSLCCHASITTVYNPHAMENEVRTIRVCTACNSETPKINMFNDWNKVPMFFINLNAHKTNNK